MSWNEVKIGLVAKGAVVLASRDKKLVAEDGYPVAVLSAYLPDSKKNIAPRIGHFENFLLQKGFRFINKKIQTSRMICDDIELLISTKEDIVDEIMVNFQVGINARERLKVWEQFIQDLCENYNLLLIDPKNGLVDSTAFLNLVKRSFAWECFLQREKKLSDEN